MNVHVDAALERNYIVTDYIRGSFTVSYFFSRCVLHLDPARAFVHKLTFDIYTTYQKAECWNKVGNTPKIKYKTVNEPFMYEGGGVQYIMATHS